MFNPLCLLLITTLCWQYASSRHLVQQPYYLPYSDYSYTYSGPGPIYHQQQHSPFFSPPGTYFDQRQGILRPFPGGGVPVLVDYHKRCSNQYVGLKAHPDQHQYYYVCKPDCVIFGKCQNLQIFNATCGQCVQHPPPEYKPTCAGVGRFPLFSDCHLYYKCEEDLQPKIYSCPTSMVFSPISKKCIDGNKCTPTQISPHSSYIPEVCVSKFPPCFENGVFRSPSDCSLYYKCDLKSNGVYMQTRLRCPKGDFYDLQKNECLPANEVPCDCIQVAELVYPKPNTMPFQPAVYPAHFELDSLEDGHYPIEQTKEESNNNSCNSSDSRIDADSKRALTSTMAPTILQTTLSNETVEQNDMETAVLSDYIDIGDENDKPISKELEELTPKTMSSEETTSTEGSNFETDFEEATNLSQESEDLTAVDQSSNEIESTQANFNEENENVAENDNDTSNNARTEITNESDNLIEDSENTLTQGSLTSILTEMRTTSFEKVETTPASKEFVQEAEKTTAKFSTRRREVETTGTTKAFKEEKETTTAKVSTRSIKSQPCENIIEIGESNDTDTLTKDTAQTQAIKCLPKLTTTISNTASEPTRTTIVSENAPSFRNTLHEHNSKIITTLITNPTNAQLPTLVSDNLVTTQLPKETTLNAEKNNLLSNLWSSGINLHTSEGQTTAEMKQAIHSLEAGIEKMHEVKNQITAEDNTELNQTVHTQSVDTNLIEDDVSFEVLLDSEKIKIPKMQATATDHTKELVGRLELAQKATEAHQNLRPPPIPLIKKQLEVEKTLPPETTTIEITQTTTVKPESTALNEKVLINTTTDNNANIIVDDEFDSIDSEIKINDFETSTQIAENLDDILLLDSNFKSSNKQNLDFSDEEFIPVHSKSIVLNESPEGTTDFVNRFDDDYTTITSEKEFTTTAASTTVRRTAQPQQEQTTQTVQSKERETTMRRRQAASGGITQLTTSQITLAADGQREEVSNNEITSAETILTTSNSKQQQFSHTPLLTFTPTQKSTATPKFTKTEPSEKQTNNLTVNVRQEDHKLSPLNSPPSQSLYYILKTTPVINNNDNKSNNETVTAAPPLIKADNGNIPRLEIIAERPIDVHLSICPITCDKNHTNNKSPAGKRAVLLKWFANKSKQTLGFETANEINTDDD